MRAPRNPKIHFIVLINYDIAMFVQFRNIYIYYLFVCICTCNREIGLPLDVTHALTKHEKVPGDKINLCIRNELWDTCDASSQQEQGQEQEQEHQQQQQQERWAQVVICWKWVTATRFGTLFILVHKAFRRVYHLTQSVCRQIKGLINYIVCLLPVSIIL